MYLCTQTTAYSTNPYRTAPHSTIQSSPKKEKPAGSHRIQIFTVISRVPSFDVIT